MSPISASGLRFAATTPTVSPSASITGWAMIHSMWSSRSSNDVSAGSPALAVSNHGVPIGADLGLVLARHQHRAVDVDDLDE